LVILPGEGVIFDFTLQRFVEQPTFNLKPTSSPIHLDAYAAALLISLAGEIKSSEAFLAKLTIVGEGITEVGFASALLEKALDSMPIGHGIWVTDGGGHDSTIDLLEALASGGMKFGGVVDNENRFPDRWKKVQEKLSDLLLRWKDGCL
jgi:hypothetical protein